MNKKIPVTKMDIDGGTISAAVSAVKSGRWVGGPRAVVFEEKFASLCGTKYAASCSSGTSALFMALLGLGVKSGDEVIVPSFSFVATASSVSMCGAVPVFADVNPENYTIDPAKIGEKISRKTRAIVPVHLFGHPADMRQITRIARKSAIPVIEDAAQAHGAECFGRPVGGLGDAACFSFYPSKNLTVCGDGGMITTDKRPVWERVKILRDHGQTARYVHDILGYNFRLDEIQAGIGSARLGKLGKNNRLRRRIAKRYTKELAEFVGTPAEEKWAHHVYHQYSIRTEYRDKLRAHLLENGVDSAVFYSIPIHKQPMYKRFNSARLPVTNDLSRNILSLPMFPSMTDRQHDRVIRTVKKFFKG